MKSTEKQDAISKTLSSICQHWTKTNDINSPSHYTLIDEDIDKLSYEIDLTEEQSEFLKDLMYELYQQVKNAE